MALRSHVHFARNGGDCCRGTRPAPPALGEWTLSARGSLRLRWPAIRLFGTVVMIAPMLATVASVAPAAGLMVSDHASSLGAALPTPNTGSTSGGPVALGSAFDAVTERA